MSNFQIGVLIWSAVMIAAIAFVRGADSRAAQRMNEIEQKKKRIRWPAAN